MTGSGKTTFAKRLVRELRALYPGVPVYVLDSKGQGDFDAWPGGVESAASPPATQIVDGIQVWHTPKVRVSFADTDAWLGGILDRRKPAIVYIDELSSIARGKSYPDTYQMLLKQGRGLRICSITLTQGLAGVDSNVMGQMSHFVRFMLQTPYDVLQADYHMGRPTRGVPMEQRQPRKTHGFFYARMDRMPRTVSEYAHLSEFFGD